MKFYLGQDFGMSYFHRVVFEHGGTGAVLMSYASVRQHKSALAILDQYPRGTQFMMDSGAFSTWNTGGKVDREDLLKFYRLIKQAYPNTHFINLDSIPGKKGRKPTKTEVDRACKESWDNYMWFKENNFEVLPVFHEDDDWKYLDMMMKETDYIAISPANDSSVNRRMVWLDKVYSKLKADYKTHGLAATSIRLLERYPFYSVDSINWKTALMYGRMTNNSIPQAEVSKIARTPQGKNLILRRELDHHVQIQNKITRLWKNRGITWKE